MSRNFVAESMKGKLVTSIPGIGNVLGQRLANKGYSEASSVFGEYLKRKDGNGDFEQWMKEECGASSKQTSECRKAFDEWTLYHL